jgi:2'-5' RNA ligase
MSELEDDIKLDFTTALVWSMPESDSLQQIQKIRAKHDKAYRNWPVHQTVWSPFVPLNMFPKIQLQMEQCTGKVTTIVMDEIGYFSQGKGKISVHLKSSNDQSMHVLFQHIKDALPNVPLIYTAFSPHLTLGQCKLEELPDMEKLIRDTIQLPIICNIDSLDLLSRQDSEPFKLITSIKLKI